MGRSNSRGQTRELSANGIGYTMADNAFVRIDDWPRAQALANSLSPEVLHRALDRYATRCCPVAKVFGQDYHWSLMQVEYATDLAFRSIATLGPLYEQLVRQSVLDVNRASTGWSICGCVHRSRLANAPARGPVVRLFGPSTSVD